MSKVPREVDDFVALPIQFRSHLLPAKQALHYLYVKPHNPQIADENARRSLFLVNIPVATTAARLRHLFNTQLGGGRIENVSFSESFPGQSDAGITNVEKSRKKRKRMTAEQIEAGLEGYSLPHVFDGQLHVGGATAILVFVDKPSMELAMKATKKIAKQNNPIVWEEGMKKESQTLGLARYEHHNQLQYPPRKELLKQVDAYMTAYAAMEEARLHEEAKKRQMPDEDGFVTVTRGPKRTVTNQSPETLRNQPKTKSEGLGDFYRFQMRERRKDEQNEMLRRFDEDKRKISEMRARRGIVKVSIVLGLPYNQKVVLLTFWDFSPA